MTHYSKKQERENRSKDMDFDHLQEIYVTSIENNYWIPLQKQDYIL